MFHPFITGTAYTDPDMERVLVRLILPVLHHVSPLHHGYCVL